MVTFLWIVSLLCLTYEATSIAVLGYENKTYEGDGSIRNITHVEINTDRKDIALSNATSYQVIELKNAPECYNDTELVITNESIDNSSRASIMDGTTMSVMEEASTVAITQTFKLVPMAVGGITLLVGLVFLSIVVGLFVYCTKNNSFVYEPALTAEVENHI